LPEVRYDILSGDMAVVATERAKRPLDFKGAQVDLAPATPRDPRCPFCPGNEQMTPPEVYAVREDGPADGPGWKVRVVPNKFPAFLPKDLLSREDWERAKSSFGSFPQAQDDSMYWDMPATGAHEVVIESPRHDITLGTMDLKSLQLVLDTLKKRGIVLYDLGLIRYVHIFRNWGPRGGASLAHPHFQIIGLPFLPTRLETEMRRFLHYQARTGRCLLCDYIERELEKDVRVVYRNASFVVLCPFASRYSYETMIVPQKHRASFLESKEELGGLSEALSKVFSRYEDLFLNLSHNLVFHSLPDSGKEKGGEYHWHIHVYPRLTVEAGLELGTGVYINPTPPEAAAREFLAEEGRSRA